MRRETLACALRNKVAKRSDFEHVNADTHVQEKFVRHPTDTRLLDRARERLVSVADRLRLPLSRNFRRKRKHMLRKCSGYAKARSTTISAAGSKP
jgi:IS5 family transposase